jgi:drug/metabolite transporter (DMT)-like permease
VSGDRRLLYAATLLVAGIGWGSTQALGKIAVSTGHGHFGLIFWQTAIGVLLLGGLQAIRGRGLPVTGATVRFAVLIALIGTLVPNTTFYIAVAHLPAGLMSILISTVPLIAFPIAVALGTDRFRGPRVLGLLCGFAGVTLIAMPGAALPGPAAAIWLAVAMIGPLCYAAEGNIVAKWGMAGLDPVQAILAATVVAMLMALPLALASGQWIDPTGPWSAPEYALILSSVINVTMYVVYVWLAQAAGAVFAAQTGYVVTAAGIGWAALLMGERFGPQVWLAVALIFAGVAMVQPRGATGEPAGAADRGAGSRGAADAPRPDV